MSDFHTSNNLDHFLKGSKYSNYPESFMLSDPNNTYTAASAIYESAEGQNGPVGLFETVNSYGSLEGTSSVFTPNYTGMYEVEFYFSYSAFNVGTTDPITIDKSVQLEFLLTQQASHYGFIKTEDLHETVNSPMKGVVNLALNNAKDRSVSVKGMAYLVSGTQYGVVYRVLDRTEIFDQDTGTDLVDTGMSYRLFKVSYLSDGTVKGNDPSIPALGLSPINNTNIQTAIDFNESPITGTFANTSNRHVYRFVIDQFQNILVTSSGIPLLAHFAIDSETPGVAPNELSIIDNFPTGTLIYETIADGSTHTYYLSVDPISDVGDYTLNVSISAAQTPALGLDPINLSNISNATYIGAITGNTSNTGYFVDTSTRYLTSFDAAPNSQFNITVVDTDCIGHMSVLIDGALTEIASVPSMLGNMMTYTTPNDGITRTVYIALNGLAIGSYSLAISKIEVGDIPDNDTTTSILTVNGPSGTGVIFPNDKDWWKVDLIEGLSYTIIEQKFNSSNLDCFLELRDSTGTFITSDDDGFGNGNSQINHTCLATGVYFIVAGGYSYSSGDYALSITSV